MSSQVHLENPRESRGGLHFAKLSFFAFTIILFFCVVESVGRDSGRASAPAVTSATTASGKVGSAFSYNITATNAPSSYGATGLPVGLTVSSGTGLISGTPTAMETSTVTLKATNRDGTGKATLTLTIAAAGPTLTGLSPASAAVGSGAQTLTLNGANFLATSTVTYNGVGHAATFVSTTQLTISLSATDQSVVGTFPVVASNPAGGVSNSANFTVTGAMVSLSPTSLAFGSQPVEMTSAPQSVILSNTGNTALAITSLAVTGANAGDYSETGNCGSSIAAGANCTIAVLFTPSAGGAGTAALSIADNATGSPQSVSLSGTGTHDVILSWTASVTSGVAGYDVYRGTTSGGESLTSLNSTPITGITFSDENVTAGLTYYYVVTAVAAGEVSQSTASNEASACIPSP